MAMIAAVPVLAFAAYDRNPTLAGILIAAWGAGAMAGSALAFGLSGRTRRHGSALSLGFCRPYPCGSW
jgi:hypothetical protein